MQTTTANSGMRRIAEAVVAPTIALLFAFLLLSACSSDEPAGDAAVKAESLNAAAVDGDGRDNTDNTDNADSVEAGAEESTAISSADGKDDADGEPTVSESAEAVGPILAETGQDLAGPELEQYLARRFEAYWQAFDIARRAPSDDPGADYPELFQLAAGEQLELAYQELGELFESGHAIREPDSPAVAGLDANSAHRVRIESLEEGVAEIVSCLVNDQVRYELDGGAVVSDSVRTVQARSTMAKADGTWKLIRSEATALDSGVAGCWLTGESDFPY